VYEGASVEEKLSGSYMTVKLFKKQKEILNLRIIYQISDEGLKIVEVSYEKGH